MLCWTNFLSFLSAIGGVATAVVAFLAYQQLKEMKQSIEDEKNWKRVNSAFTYFPKSHEFNEMEHFLNASFIKLIDRSIPLSSNEVAKLFQDNQESNEVLIKLKNYLNLLEGYCAAIEMGAVDNEAAKKMYIHKFTRHYDELLPYISQAREKYNDRTLFISFETVVKDWKEPYNEA